MIHIASSKEFPIQVHPKKITFILNG